MQRISAVADIKASTKGSWHEFDLTRIREGIWGLLGQTEQPASAGHPTQPTYHINVIKWKWEV